IMLLSKLRIWMFIFFALLYTLDAKKCQKVKEKDGCEDCTNDYFQPEDNDSKSCQSCTVCDTNAGSETKDECTKDTDTVCQCRGDFVAWASDSSPCHKFYLKKKKFHLINNCKAGYFSTKMNEACSKWKDCQSTGVKIPGSTTSDAICNDNSTVAKTRFLNKTESTSQINHPPHEGARTLMMLTTNVTRAPQKTTTEENFIPTQLSERANHNDCIFILLGIAGVLFILTVVSYKKDVVPCWLRKTTEAIQSMYDDSLTLTL
uniref:Tumor necrosis factor receptor superfamily member 1B-like n=1 Tax=Gouania willdenowi TaxID=441366 RepID=A0A8C5HLC9_GOUWI